MTPQHLLAIATLITILMRTAITHSAEPIDIDSTVEVALFSFDNVAIPFTHNLQLSMQRPKKHAGNPVVRRGAAGTPDEFGVQFYGSVIRDKDRFRMWYVAIDRELQRDPGCVDCLRPAYAESRDGIHWIKPELGLVEYQGNNRNNLVQIEPAPLGIINLKVLDEPDDPQANHRYKMSAQTWWREGRGRGRGTLAPLFSGDGLRWRLAVDAKPVRGLLPVENLVLPRHHFEAAGGLYKWKGVYFASGQSSRDYRHGTGNYTGREVLMHRSRDFVKWSQTASIGFLRDEQYGNPFPHDAGKETHEGVSVWHRGNVLIGLSGMWQGAKHKKDVTIDLGLLVSNDGIHFREPIRDWIFLQHGEDGKWDEGGLLQGQGFANVGDKTLIWYGSWDPRVGTNYQPRGGVGLATLPRDRFGALAVRTSDQPAEFVSGVLQADASRPATARQRLYVNADGLSQDARLRFELLDEQEHPLAGFSGEHAAIVDEGGFRTPVSWQTNRDTAHLPARFRLRVSFEGKQRDRVRFYAAYVSSNTGGVHE